jgi:hypothetical protein
MIKVKLNVLLTNLITVKVKINKKRGFVSRKDESSRPKK